MTFLCFVYEVFCQNDFQTMFTMMTFHPKLKGLRGALPFQLPEKVKFKVKVKFKEKFIISC